ncbi:hypothetical protein ACVFYP_23950 [Roseomonas sp. F4]
MTAFNIAARTSYLCCQHGKKRYRYWATSLGATMFGSEILEVAVGLILMFLLFSLLMTAARESLEAVLKSRANNLQQALVELLGPPGDRSLSEQKTAEALKAFQQHPLIYALYRGDTVKTGLGTNAPSYIPSMAFAAAVADLINAGEQLPPDSAAARAYQMFTRQGGEGSEQIKAEMAAWYDSAMDRTSGMYRRHTQWFMFLGGLVFAVALNFNAVVIAKHLSVDQTTRESIVRMAERTSAEGAPLSADEVIALDAAVRVTGLPIGWGESVRPSMPKLLFGGFGGTTLLELAMGYLAFALAATLGAPFWFDLLSKVIAIRSTMKPETAQSSSAPTPAALQPATQVVVTTTDGEGRPVPDRLTAPDQPFVYG